MQTIHAMMWENSRVVIMAPSIFPLTQIMDFDTLVSSSSYPVSVYPNNLTLNFWGIYEMGFPEGSDMIGSKENFLSLRPFPPQPQKNYIPQATSPEEVGLSKERLQRISAWIQTDVDKKVVPGAIVMVLRKDQIDYYEAFG